MKTFLALLVLVVVAYEVPETSACTSIPSTCAIDTDCCSGSCMGSQCVCAHTYPTTGLSNCALNSDCCSNKCGVNGKCACSILTGPCSTTEDCCYSLLGLLPPLICLSASGLPLPPGPLPPVPVPVSGLCLFSLPL